MRSHVLAVRSFIQATPRNRIITIDLESVAFDFHAGQAVFAGLANGNVRRPYSIACSPTQARQNSVIELLVQIDDHTPPDPHLERAVPGTQLRVEGPFGSFGLPSTMTERQLLFIAGGTGIAPLRAMMWETLAHRTGVDVALIYSARSPDEFAYRDELNALAAQGRIDLQMTITRDTAARWTGGRGRIDGALIRSMLKSAETRCVICGPPALVKDATTTLEAAGVAGPRIMSETFSG